MRIALGSAYTGSDRPGAEIEVPDEVGASWVESALADPAEGDSANIADTEDDDAPTAPPGKGKKVTTPSETK